MTLPDLSPPQTAKDVARLAVIARRIHGFGVTDISSEHLAATQELMEFMGEMRAYPARQMALLIVLGVAVDRLGFGSSDTELAKFLDVALRD